MCQAYIQGDVSAYPAKVKRAKKKTQHTVACVLHTGDAQAPKVYVMQRPPTGLLAGMWEFLCAQVKVGATQAAQRAQLRALLDAMECATDELLHHGQFTHVFSHISMSIDVWSARLDSTFDSQPPHQWVERSQLNELGLSASQVKAWELAKHAVGSAQAPAG